MAHGARSRTFPSVRLGVWWRVHALVLAMGCGGPPTPALPPAAEPDASAFCTNASEPGPDAVDVNTASATELLSLPGIGEHEAEAIVEHRQMFGPYFDVSELAGEEGPLTTEAARRLCGRVIARPPERTRSGGLAGSAGRGAQQPQAVEPSETPSEEAATQAQLSAPPEGPCDGTELALDAILRACRTDASEEPMPGPEVLALSVDDPGTVVGGSSLQLVVRLTNVSTRSVRFVAGVSPHARVTVYDAQGRDALNPEVHGGALGVLATPHPTVAVTLRPGGMLVTRVSVRLNVHRECTMRGCTASGPSPLAPGLYRVEVTTGFPLVDDEGRRSYRTVSRAIHVVPHR